MNIYNLGRLALLPRNGKNRNGANSRALLKELNDLAIGLSDS
jgi:hypothetical protein